MFTISEIYLSFTQKRSEILYLDRVFVLCIEIEMINMYEVADIDLKPGVCIDVHILMKN